MLNSFGFVVACGLFGVVGGLVVAYSAKIRAARGASYRTGIALASIGVLILIAIAAGGFRSGGSISQLTVAIGLSVMIASFALAMATIWFFRKK